MENHRKKQMNFLQNVSIALLTLSAVVLFAQTQFYNLRNSSESWLSLFGPVPADNAIPSTQTSTLSAPLRVAVSDTYGRYGNISMTTSDEEFAPLGGLLNTALGSAKEFLPCSEVAYLAALTSTSVYYDFLSPLPVSVIAALSNVDVENTLSARTLIICAANSTNVKLYLWDGSTGYYQANTSASQNDLTEIVSRYELGIADFAMDLVHEVPAYANIHPCSLLLRELPLFSELSVSVPSQATDRLLLALNFNPNTKYRSTETDNTEVIVENNRSLRVHPNGMVHYLSSDTAALTIKAETNMPTLQETVLLGSAFLAELSSALIGDASFYLQEIHQNEGITLLRFGYQISGIPVHFSNGGYAAEMTLIGTAITSLDLNLRQYTVSGTNTSLLPLKQALAIAADTPATELSIGYVDQGGSASCATWLAN